MLARGVGHCRQWQPRGQTVLKIGRVTLCTDGQGARGIGGADQRRDFAAGDLDEVLQKQGKKLGKDQQDQQEKFRTIYTLHVEKSKQFLHANNISFIEIQHRELLEDPETTLQHLIDFCSWETPMEELNSVIDQSLYRNRKNA